MLPIYKPGDVIAQADFISLFEHPQLPFPWKSIYGRGKTTVKPGENGLYLENHSGDGALLVVYGKDLDDLPVAVSAKATFSNASSSLMLVCRSNSMGYYGFSIKPNGQWAIIEDVSISAELKHISQKTLAQGTSSRIRPDRNQMTAICRPGELVFEVNGKEVGRVPGDLLLEGKVGVGVGIDSLGTFTDFTVSRVE